MENTEIIKNEEVIETATEEIATSKLPKGLKIAGGVVVVTGIAYLAYKYMGKPLYRKLKAKKEQSGRVIAVVSENDDDLEEVND